MNDGRVSLPADETLRLQLMGLQRKVLASGYETVEHRSGQHDDTAAAVAGLVALAHRGVRRAPALEVW